MIVPATSPRVWRLPVLFVRTRGLPQTVLAIAAASSLLLMLEGRVAKGMIDPLLVLQIVPSLLGSAIGVGMWAPIGELERTSARSMPLLRGGFVVGLVALAVCGAAIALQGWPVAEVEGIAVRNILGMTGLALIAARAVDPRLSWIAPLAWTCVAIITGWIARPESGIAGWVWSALEAEALSSWLIAGGLAVAGVAIVALLGPRDIPSETV